MSADIAGPDEVQPEEECTWQAIGDGGFTPYSYSWWGGNTGSSEFLTGSLLESSYQWLEITDDVGAKDTAQVSITVDEEAGACSA